MQSAELIAEIENTPRVDPASIDSYDAIALRAELKWLDEIDHPWGPFVTYERHLEFILSQYDIDSPESPIVQPSRIRTRKESVI